MVLASRSKCRCGSRCDGRVLIGQFTTDGVVNLTLNFQWDDETSDTFNNEGISIVFPEVPVPGCTNPAADNYNPLANEDDGSCTSLEGSALGFFVRPCCHRPAQGRGRARTASTPIFLQTTWR